MIDRLRCRGNLANNKVSVIYCARGTKTRSAHSPSSSGLSESDFLLGSKVSLCNLCFAKACDCGLTHFCCKMIITSSSFRLLLAYMFPNVCSVVFDCVK